MAQRPDPKSRHLPPTPTALLVALDVLLLVGAAAAAYALAGLGYNLLDPRVRGAVRGLLEPGFLLAWTLAHAGLVPVLLHALGQYRVANSPRGEMSFNRILLAAFAADAGLLLFLAALGARRPDVLFVAFHFVFAVAGLAFWRLAQALHTRSVVRRGRHVRNVLLVGDNDSLLELGRRFVADPLWGRRVMGFATASPLPAAPPTPGTWTPGAIRLEDAIQENSLRQPRNVWASFPLPSDADRARAVDGLGIEEIFVGNGRPDDELTSWMRLAQHRGVDLHLVPRNHHDMGLRPQPWKAAGIVVFDLHSQPINRLGWVLKRTLDIAGGAIGLLLGAPLMLLAALAIKAEDPRLPVFYGGSRVGYKGRKFAMLKFTTMRADAQRIEAGLQDLNQRQGPWFKVDSAKDPRLTRSGRWIRRFNVNEIPQFWNVLRGDMSLVGPRPPTPDEVATYLAYDIRYFQVLDAKPGITGLWQVTARNDPSFDRRLELDLQYMREWSIWLDLRILVRTVTEVFKAGD